MNIFFDVIGIDGRGFPRHLDRCYNIEHAVYVCEYEKNRRNWKDVSIKEVYSDKEFPGDYKSPWDSTGRV